MTMCDSFLEKVQEGVYATLHAKDPLPATTHSAAPLPEEGIYLLYDINPKSKFRNSKSKLLSAFSLTTYICCVIPI